MENADFKFQIKSYQQMQKIPRNAYNIALCIYDRYFTCFEAVNLVQS